MPITLNFTQKLQPVTIQSNSSVLFPTSKQIKNGKDCYNKKLDSY